jgi:hypothetical protein
VLLHEDRDLFRKVIFSTAADLELPVPVVEKIGCTCHSKSHSKNFDTGIFSALLAI